MKPINVSVMINQPYNFSQLSQRQENAVRKKKHFKKHFHRCQYSVASQSQSQQVQSSEKIKMMIIKKF